MASKKQMSKRTREELLAFCGELQDDDCIDPKEYFKPNRQLAKANKKAKQLSRQVGQTLELTIADCDDEWMQLLRIVRVQPAPDSSRLLVTIGVDMPRDQFDRDEILTRLQVQTGRLRAEIGRSISRKRIPNLTFSVFLCSDLKKENNDE